MASSSSFSDSSDSEWNSSGYEEEIFGEVQPLGVIQPWRYEPQGTSHDSSDDSSHEEPVDEDHHSDRLDNTDWYRLSYKY